MSIIALGQGVPFFFGGDDLLRSKDMDDNSYNSGDWFSRVNWTLAEEEHNPSLLSQESNNWGIGLPVQNVNGGQWPIMQPLLANPALTPTPKNISSAAEAFQMFLRIRRSSALFHMATLNEVQNNLHFLNTGTSQVPGLIVMKLDNNRAGLRQLPAHRRSLQRNPRSHQLPGQPATWAWLYLHQRSALHRCCDRFIINKRPNRNRPRARINHSRVCLRTRYVVIRRWQSSVAGFVRENTASRQSERPGTPILLKSFFQVDIHVEQNVAESLTVCVEGERARDALACRSGQNEIESTEAWNTITFSWADD